MPISTRNQPKLLTSRSGRTLSTLSVVTTGQPARCRARPVVLASCHASGMATLTRRERRLVAGRVILRRRQVPAAGTGKRNDRLTQYSRGLQRRSVPVVRGLTARDAATRWLEGVRSAGSDARLRRSHGLGERLW